MLIRVEPERHRAGREACPAVEVGQVLHRALEGVLVTEYPPLLDRRHRDPTHDSHLAMAARIQLVQEEGRRREGLEQPSLQHPAEVTGSPLDDRLPGWRRPGELAHRQGDVHERVGMIDRIAIAVPARNGVGLGGDDVDNPVGAGYEGFNRYDGDHELSATPKVGLGKCDGR